MRSVLLRRMTNVGLGDQERYGFTFAPAGFPVTRQDLEELGSIARAAASFLAAADEWYRQTAGNTHWTGILEHSIPRGYQALLRMPGMGVTTMIDTVWTEGGWRIVEIDATNRNGLGFPAALRSIYDLPGIWKGNAAAWVEEGWTGVLQVMAERCRFYRPYYEFFLGLVGGRLIPEMELEGRIAEAVAARRLLDWPVFHKGSWLQEMTGLAGRIPVGIPPKHHLASKAMLALAWEEVFDGHPVREYLPHAQLLRRPGLNRYGDFFVKTFQSGGAQGTFHNDHEAIKRFAARRPQAILQEALPIAQRRIEFLDGDIPRAASRFIRLSIYVTPEGRIVDADVTASEAAIVHGGRNSILTLPVPV